MRQFVKYSLLILLLAGFAPFILPGPDGRRMLQWDDLRWPEVAWPDWATVDVDALPSVTPERSEPRTVYKWRDGNGDWHYGDEPPAGVAAEPMTIAPDANVVAPVEPPAAADTGRDAADETPAPAGGYGGALQRARDAAGKIEGRQQDIDRALQERSGAR